MKDRNCPFCGHYPYEMVDVGIGHVPVAVNCCEFGPLIFDWRTSKADAEKASSVVAAMEAGKLTNEQAHDELYRYFGWDAA